MDPGIGDVFGGDVLVEGDRIAAVGHAVEVGDAEVVDTTDWWYASALKAPEDVRRVREQYFSSDDGLMTLATATRGPGFCAPEVVRHDWELARDMAHRSASTSAWGRSPGASPWSRS
jgi:hypothetical protein